MSIKGRVEILFSFFLTNVSGMIRTRNIIISIDEVPATWVFEYFAKLPPLTGQDESILSIFNPKDSKPSMVFYVKHGEYLFNDFSTGKGGDKCTFYKLYVKHKQGRTINYGEACKELMEAFSKYLLTGAYENNKLENKPSFKVVGYENRDWFEYDAKYWTQFNISSDILKFYNVRPISHLKLDNGIEQISIRRGMMYGYYQQEKILYRTYAPMEEKARRFNRYTDYIQGSEQLRFNKPMLVICSSLKDCMSLFSLGYNIDVIAPSSENTYFDKEEIDALRNAYPVIKVLFDNDNGGLVAAGEYRSRFGLENIELPLSKDISDSIRDFGIQEVTNILNPHLS